MSQAKGPGALDGPLTGVPWRLPDSIWKVSYGTDPDTGGMGGLLTMVGVVAAGALALLLSVFCSGGRWRATCARHGTLVNLGEAIMRRENASCASGPVASTRDAIALLGQYARVA